MNSLNQLVSNGMETHSFLSVSENEKKRRNSLDETQSFSPHKEQKVKQTDKEALNWQEHEQAIKAFQQLELQSFYPQHLQYQLNQQIAQPQESQNLGENENNAGSSSADQAALPDFKAPKEMRSIHCHDGSISLNEDQIKLLAEHSEYFKSLFFSPFKEANSNDTIELSDFEVSSEDLKEMMKLLSKLDLLQVEEVDWDKDLHILQLAQKLLVRTLEERMQEKLIDALRTDFLDIEDLKRLYDFFSTMQFPKLLIAWQKQISQWLREDFKARISQIQDLPLSFLDLSYSQVDDEDVSKLSQFSIKVLKLSHCKHLTEKGLISIDQNFKDLQELDLSGYTGAVSETFKKANYLRDLKALNLRDCRHLKEPTFISICKTLTKLESLNVENCSVLTIKSAPELKRLKNLTHLQIDGADNQMISDMVVNLGQLHSLTLHAPFQDIDDKTVKTIIQLPKLRRLELLGFQINDQAVEVLCKNADQLELLSIRLSKILTQQSLRMIFTDLKKLRHLKLTNCEFGNQETEMENIADENLSQLQFLDLGGSSYLNGQNIVALSKNFKSLKFLNLDHCSLINDLAIDAICENAKQLQFLNISECPQLSDQALINISKQLKKLRLLDMGHCNFSLKALIEMSENLKQLQYLYVDGWQNFDDETVERMVKNAKQLRVLHLGEGKRLTALIVKVFAKNLEQLEELHIEGCHKKVKLAFQSIQNEFKGRPSISFNHSDNGAINYKAGWSKNSYAMERLWFSQTYPAHYLD